MPPGVGDHPAERDVARERDLHDAAHGELLVVAVRGPQQLDQVAGARVGLQAAAVAAAAHPAGLVQRDVPDLAGRAADAPVHAAAHQDAGADAGGQLDVGGLGHAAGRAPGGLAERAQVGVVVDVHGAAEAADHLLTWVDAGPARQDRHRSDRAAGLDRPGHAQADADDVLRLGADPAQRDAHQPFGLVQAERGRGVDVDRDGFLRDDLVRQVADGDADVRVAEVDADDQAGRTRQRHGAGPAAAGAGGPHRDDTGGAELTDDVGHRGRGQASGAGDLRLGQRPGGAHRADDAPLVGLPQRSLRSRRRRRGHPPSPCRSRVEFRG